MYTYVYVDSSGFRVSGYTYISYIVYSGLGIGSTDIYIYNITIYIYM